MQLRFDDASREDLAFDQGEISLGGGPDDDVALPHAAPRLARLRRRTRQILLDVDAEAHVQVNGRPVRSLALLRAGDQLTVETTQMTLVSSRPNQPPPSHLDEGGDEFEHQPTLPPQLRWLSGDHSGQLVAVNGALPLGADGEHPAPVTVEATRDAVVAKSQQEGQLVVNGHEVTEAMLRHGDQIRVAQHRLELEAPAYRAGPPVTGQHDILFKEPSAEAQAAPATDVGVSGSDKVIIGICLAACVAMVLLVALRL